MARNPYRLETVEEVRKRAKEQAMLVVAERRVALSNEERLLESTESDCSEHREIIVSAKKNNRDEISRGTSAGSIVSGKMYVEDLYQTEAVLAGNVEMQKKQVEIAIARLSESIEALREATKAFAVIEKHKEKWEKSQKLRVIKEEQKLLDEISSILHERSKRL